MKQAFLNLIESMKFWTMVLGLLVTLGAKYGINIDATTQAEIIGFFAVLLGAQGLTDHGKAAAAITAAAAPTLIPGQLLTAETAAEKPAIPMPLPAPAGGAS